MSGCNSEETHQGQVPVYQGTTITSIATEEALTPVLNVASASYHSDPANNQRPHGSYDGDYHGHNPQFDKDNPFPYNKEQENIENEIQTSLTVIGSAQDVYCANQNENVYINIHIDNPDNFEILSFTLNDKKYSSYMFEEGSNMETLILKYNVGETSGICEYTIDAIKYVDGNTIKDVKMEGDKTVKVGIRKENQISTTLSNVVITPNDMTFKVEISDADNLIAYSNGTLKAVIYDGEALVSSQDLAIGSNNVTFNGLKTNTLYQYAIVGYYDDFSGDGFRLNVLYKDSFYTQAIVLFDEISVEQESISFALRWYEPFANKTLSSLQLYKGETLEKSLSVGDTNIGGLLSAADYALVAQYKNADTTETIRLDFTTKAKTVPALELRLTQTAQTSLTFDITEADADNIGVITEIKFTTPNGERITNEQTGTVEFTDLTHNSLYKIQITYVYDLNDGTGSQTVTKEIAAYTTADTRGIQYTLVDDHYEVAHSGVDTPEMVILSHIGGIPVTTITSHALTGKTFLRTLIIENGVTTIGESAFLACGNLERVTLPDSLQTIEESAFSGCVNLKSISIPSSVTTIGPLAFSSCTALTDITLSNGLQTIGRSAFYDCHNVMNITIPASVTAIDGGAFARCFKLVEVYNYSALSIETERESNGGVAYYAKAVYTMPHASKITTDENGFILYNNNVLIGYAGKETELTLPDDIIEIHQAAFFDCATLTKIEIPSSVRVVGTEAFTGCKNLSYNQYGGLDYLGNDENPYMILVKPEDSNISSATIHSNTKFIHSGAFRHNALLQRIEIPDSVIDIGEQAFLGCRALNEIVIGENVRTIGARAFYGCHNVSSIIFKFTDTWEVNGKIIQWSDFETLKKYLTAYGIPIHDTTPGFYDYTWKRSSYLWTPIC